MKLKLTQSIKLADTKWKTSKTAFKTDQESRTNFQLAFLHVPDPLTLIQRVGGGGGVGVYFAPRYTSWNISRTFWTTILKNSQLNDVIFKQTSNLNRFHPPLFTIPTLKVDACLWATYSSGCRAKAPCFLLGTGIVGHERLVPAKLDSNPEKWAPSREKGPIAFFFKNKI